MTHQPPQIGAGLAALFALTLCLPALLLPAFAGPHAVLGHRDSDVYTALWDIDFVGDSLAQGHLPLHTDRVNWPNAGALFPSKPLLALIASALRPLLGLTLAYNATIWLLLAAGVWGMFLLAQRLTGQALGGLVAGVVFGASPFVAGYAVLSGAPELLGLGLVPAALFFLQRSAHEGGKGDVVAGGAFLGASLASSAYVIEMVALLIPVWLVLSAVRRPALWLGDAAPDAPTRWRPPALGFALGVALAAPFVIALLVTLRAPDSIIGAARFADVQPRPPFPDFQPGAVSAYVAGLLDFVRPHLAPVSEGSLFLKTVTLTWGALLLGGVGLWRRRRTAWPLAAAAALFAGLAAGPYLLLTAQVGLPGPYNPLYLVAYYVVPHFDQFLEPFRLGLIVALFVALLAAAGAVELSRRFGRWGTLAALALLALSLLETAWLVHPYVGAPDLARVPSSAAVVLTAEKTAGAVVELPFTDPRDPGLMRRDRFGNQTAHGRPIVDNLTGFFPALVRDNGVLGRLLAWEGAAESEPAMTPQHGLAQLREAGVGALLVDECLYRRRNVDLPGAVRELVTSLGLVWEPVDACLRVVDLTH